jgi:hypothetical protein
VSALDQFSVAFVTAEYYFTEEEGGHRDTGSCNIVEGAWVGLSKHTGSLAFGAAIVALFEFLSALLQFLQRRNEEMGDNKVVEVVLSCVEVLCCCLKGFVEYINKNVYIDIAINGDNNFCTAIRAVMETTLRYGAAMMILNGATFIFQLVGTLVISACCGLLAEFMIYDGEMVVNMTLIVAMLLGYAVAFSFMAVFDTTTDTLLYCYAFDKSSNKATASTAPKEMLALFSKAETQTKEREQKAKEDKEKGRRDKATQDFLKGLQDGGGH